MTEEEWLTNLSVGVMLECVHTERYTRKHRLFAVACCRRVADVMTDNGRKAVDAAELYADALIPKRQLHQAWKAVGTPTAEARTHAAFAAQCASATTGLVGTARVAAQAVEAAGWRASSLSPGGARLEEQSAQADLLRDIFGNPFRPVVFDPSWRSETAVALASAIYEERAFDRMPILADALQEAGCDHADVLTHCRDPKITHVRGCWVIDLLLGKE